MSAPETPFETSGAWTSLAAESAFLASLEGVGGLSLEGVGDSVQGRPIWVCKVGTGPNTVLIGSFQHALEPATRESSFALLRDLAYRTEPWMDAWLESHRVVVIPTLNPDGHVLGTRNNANGVNLNRDWLKLSQPETRAAQLVIAETDPDVVMDAHETSGQPGADWRPYPAGYPGEETSLRDLATAFVTQTEPVFAGQGWSTLWYPVNLLPFAGLSTAAGAQGRVGVLSETVSAGIPAAQRVRISHETYLELLQWYGANLAEVQQARSEAAQSAASGQFQTPIPTREYVRTEPATTTKAAGYTVAGAIPQYLVDAFGIQSVNGVIPLDQPARLVVAALCDPGSSERVIDATPYYQPAAGVGHGISGVVERGGVRFPIQQVITQVAGARFPVSRVVTQDGGVRYDVTLAPRSVSPPT